jgi:hypothetical protein
MRLQHLVLFRGIGLGAYAVNLVAECLQRASRLWRLPSDHHTVAVEVAPDFPLRLPNVALRHNRFLRFVNSRKSEIHDRNQ